MSSFKPNRLNSCVASTLAGKIFVGLLMIDVHTKFHVVRKLARIYKHSSRRGLAWKEMVQITVHCLLPNKMTHFLCLSRHGFDFFFLMDLLMTNMPTKCHTKRNVIFIQGAQQRQTLPANLSKKQASLTFRETFQLRCHSKHRGATENSFKRLRKCT